MIILRTSIICFLGIFSLAFSVLYGEVDSSPVQMPREYVSVRDFSGTADERINAAITEAMRTRHKTVLLPNGTYPLRDTILLNRGKNSEVHLVGESRKGVVLIPDIAYLEANYKGGNGAKLAHMINLTEASVFDSLNVSIQNLTVDMKAQFLSRERTTYTVVGHGIRVGQGWRSGQFKVNQVTIRNTPGYGIGIQDRGGHPKNNLSLTNLLIQRTGSDGVDTKEASGEGNQNLTIGNVTVMEIGFTDSGVAVALDIRYQNVVIDNVHLVSKAGRKTPYGATSRNVGILFRADGPAGEAKVSNVYIRGFSTAIQIAPEKDHETRNIEIRDFVIHDHTGAAIQVAGSGHTIVDGYIHSERGRGIIGTSRGSSIRKIENRLRSDLESIAQGDPSSAPLRLPADNIEITDTEGRTITVSIEEINARGISIRNRSMRRFFIEWGRLSSETIERITGSRTPPSSSP